LSITETNSFRSKRRSPPKMWTNLKKKQVVKMRQTKM
jgi:hypothetical protein